MLFECRYDHRAGALPNNTQLYWHTPVAYPHPKTVRLCPTLPCRRLHPLVYVTLKAPVREGSTSTGIPPGPAPPGPVGDGRHTVGKEPSNAAPACAVINRLGPTYPSLTGVPKSTGRRPLHPRWCRSMTRLTFSELRSVVHTNRPTQGTHQRAARPTASFWREAYSRKRAVNKAAPACAVINPLNRCPKSTRPGRYWLTLHCAPIPRQASWQG